MRRCWSTSTASRVTYAELLADSHRWATCLRRLGIDAGSHVATLLPNIFDAHRSMLASAGCAPSRCR